MQLNHVSIRAGSEENSDHFFVDLLGLNKARVKEIPAELSGRLFGLEKPFRLVDYDGADFKFEVFIDPDGPPPAPETDHVCLAVEDRASFLEKARAMGFEVREAAKAASTVVFIRDLDGNQYEIK